MIYDDPYWTTKSPTPEELVARAREQNPSDVNAVYPCAFGALTFHYNDLVVRFDLLLKRVRELASSSTKPPDIDEDIQD